MATTLTELQIEIETFLTETGMYATHFGLQAVKNPNFVFDLRTGKRESITLRTLERVKAFMRDHRYSPDVILNNQTLSQPCGKSLSGKASKDFKNHDGGTPCATS